MSDCTGEYVHRLAAALEEHATKNWPYGMAYGTFDPGWECPWEMGEIDWVEMAEFALERVRSGGQS